MRQLLRSDIYENLMMALGTLRANKLRSALTVVGVVIGVWTVMAIASIISGIDEAVKKAVESFGTRSIIISKFDPGIHVGRRSREERMRKNLTYDDAIALRALPTIETSMPLLDITNNFFGSKLNVSANGKTSSAVRLQGTLPDYDRAGIMIISQGRWFSQFENDNNEEVCVIGSTVADTFFPTQSPLDQTIQIGGSNFRVLGVFEPREQLGGGGTGTNDQNNVIYIPYNVAHKLKPDAEQVTILAIARAGQMDEAVDQVTDMLRVRRSVSFSQPNDFGISTAESIISQFRSITAGIALAMVAISSVGLMVGGIGVMNIMLVSVTERTREIGMRKAIGARRKDILWQFLIEAATLTGFGGLVGLLMGWATTLLIRLFVPSYVPVWAPIAGFVASVGIGIVFGLWPAWKAARLDPIEALRYE
ncbi:MAG: multidrug ABC transporter substrate-binding protein [Acidobacteria bacterium]|nr:MAG: multidrug ABC transporter substrate-binding protein [Acidobacteriota bacterium]PYS84275.1 MAG: multidrug ABC transporter substrate-binding protein [Acidobacteriota bacterium]